MSNQKPITNNTSILSSTSRKEIVNQKSLNNTSGISSGSSYIKRLRTKENYQDILRERLGLGTSMIEVKKTKTRLAIADRSISKDDKINKSLGYGFPKINKNFKKSQTMSFRKHLHEISDENILDSKLDSKMDINELKDESENEEEKRKKEEEELKRKKEEEEEKRKKEEEE